MNIPGLVDLAPVLAILATLAGSGYSTSNLLTQIRKMALNGWMVRLAEEQRTAIYQAILLVLNYAVIFGLAVATGFHLDWNLAGAVLLAAIVATAAAHYGYNNAQKISGSDPAGMTAPDPTTADGAPGQA